MAKSDGSLLPYALSAAGFGPPNSPRMVWPLGQVHSAPNAPADSNPLTRGVAELRSCGKIPSLHLQSQKIIQHVLSVNSMHLQKLYFSRGTIGRNCGLISLDIFKQTGMLSPPWPKTKPIYQTKRLQVASPKT